MVAVAVAICSVSPSLTLVVWPVCTTGACIGKGKEEGEVVLGGSSSQVGRKLQGQAGSRTCARATAAATAQSARAARPAARLAPMGAWDGALEGWWE